MAQVAHSDAAATNAPAANSPPPADRQAIHHHHRPHPPPHFPLHARPDAPVSSLPPHHMRPDALQRDTLPLYNPVAIQHAHAQPQPAPADLPANSVDPRFSPLNHAVTHPALTPEQQPLIAPPTHSPHHLDTPQSAQPIMPMLNTFAEMSLGPPHMHYPAPVPLMPLQPQPIVPLVSAHHANHHLAHARHASHPNQAHLVANQATTVGHWVPQDHVGAVIGGQGTVIRSLQEKSGATIQVHNDMIRGEHKLFTVHGLPSQIDTAIQLVMEIVERPRSMPSSGSDRASNYASRHESSAQHEMSKTMFVPTSCVGLVIGRNGETIRNLQDKSGAEIKVTPDGDSAPAQQSRSILISGSEDAINAAQQMVTELVRDARTRRPPYHNSSAHTGDPPHVEVLSVPNDKVGLIIGKKGMAIRDLQIRSGAKIQVSKDDNSVHNGTRPVTITGTRPQVEDAKALIADKVELPYLPPSSAPPQLTPPSAKHPYQPPGRPSRGVHLLPNASNAGSVQYSFPQMYESEYANGQHPGMQPAFDSADPNGQPRPPPMAYFQYMGYNNYAAVSQHPRQFPHTMSVPPVSHPGPHNSNPAVAPGQTRVPLQMEARPSQAMPTQTLMEDSAGAGGAVIAVGPGGSNQSLGTGRVAPRSETPGAVRNFGGATVPAMPVAAPSPAQEAANGSLIGSSNPHASNGNAAGMFPSGGYPANEGATLAQPNDVEPKRSYAGDVGRGGSIQLAGSTGKDASQDQEGAPGAAREQGRSEVKDEKSGKKVIREAGAAERAVENGEG